METADNEKDSITSSCRIFCLELQRVAAKNFPPEISPTLWSGVQVAALIPVTASSTAEMAKILGVNINVINKTGGVAGSVGMNYAYQPEA